MASWSDRLRSPAWGERCHWSIPGVERCRSLGLREAVAKRPSPLEEAGGY
ncbi:MAG: hypothetical protein NXI25_26340 [bacterium]|nr:hypothetical protein [bacterium]